MGSAITSIGDSSFANSKLTSLIIPDSVTIIGQSAFKGTQLTSLVIPDSVTHIGDKAFASNQLVSVSFLGNRPEIDSLAFENNYSLNTIHYCQNTNMAWDDIDIEGIVFEQDVQCQINWDLDGNGMADALTDGLMLLRHNFGLTGESLTDAAISSDSPLSSEEVESKVEAVYEIADIDSNGSVDALTDGLMLLRYLFGLTGNSLTEGAVANNATRTDAVEIEAYIQSKMP